MGELNPEYIKAIIRRVNEAPYFDLLSMELKDIGMGVCLFELEVKEKHLQTSNALYAEKSLHLQQEEKQR